MNVDIRTLLRRKEKETRDGDWVRQVWDGILRRWNVVRPGWPAPVFGLFAALALTIPSQGKEILYSVSSPCVDRRVDTVQQMGRLCGQERFNADFFNWQFPITFLALFLCGALLFGVFLIAVRRYYPTFSQRAQSGFPVRYRSAAAVGLLVPVWVGVYYWLTLGLQSPAFLASVLVIALLLMVFEFVRRFSLRLYSSAFSLIIVVGDRLRLPLLAALALGVAGAAIILAFPVVGETIGPVALALYGVTMWTAAITYLVTFFERRGWPPVALLVPVLALVVALVDGAIGGGRNRIDLIPAAQHAELPGVDARAAAWLQAYRERHPGQPVRAIVVLAEGGGIRSALQTGAALTALDIVSQDQLTDHVYAMSGVSGGSVGLATYLAARRQYQIPAGEDEAARARLLRATAIQKLLSSDHFSSLLAGAFFLDLPLGFAPIFEGDRARSFERSLNRPFHDGTPNVMREPFLATADAQAGVDPIVIFNTVRANDGGLDVISNVDFNRADRTTRLCNVLDRVEEGQTISLATAAGLSARFPLVSPPAVLRVMGDPADGALPGPCAPWRDTLIRYVDGGYLDNSGALSATEAVSALRRAAERARSTGDAVQLDIIVLHIFARTIPTENEGPLKTSNNFMPELTGPLDAFFGARGMHGLTPVENLCRLIAEESGVDEENCAELASYRRRPVDSVAQITTRACEDFNLSWFNMHLDVREDEPSREDYVPLGWVLGGASQQRVISGAGSRADTTWERLRTALNDPSQATVCAAPPPVAPPAAIEEAP